MGGWVDARKNVGVGILTLVIKVSEFKAEGFLRRAVRMGMPGLDSI